MNIQNQARRCAAALLAVMLLLTACGVKSTATAATMHLRRSEGEVSVSDDGGKDVEPRENLGLYSGYGIRTRGSSYAWIDLDDVKLAKMDQDSRITIEKEGKELEIRLRSGNLFFNVTEPLEDGETMNIRTSTMLVGIRGTCGWVEELENLSRVYILEGKVKCSSGDESVRVQAGEMAEVTEDGKITVTGFTVRDILDFIWEELLEDEDLAESIFEDSGIDVLNPPGPDNLTGVVTDLVTGRPLKGVTVICENGVDSARSETDENGVYHISGLPAGEYQIFVSRDDCEEGSYAAVVPDGGAATLDLTLRPFYAQAYMDYLLNNQEGMAGLVTYPRGRGRFALVQMTDDDIPELLQIGENDMAHLYTCLDGEMRHVDLDNGGTDVPYVTWNRLRIIDENVFASTFDSEWWLYEREPDKTFTYVLRAKVLSRDGAYYHNEYDESIMTSDWSAAYEYLMDFEDQEVSQAEYEQALAAYGVDGETNLRLTEDDLHYITPEEIAAVFAGR